MKRPTIATALNFVVPGAGLWYLGHGAWAALNFCVATAIVVAAALLVPGLFEEYAHYVVFAVAAGSAGLAHAAATQQRAGNPTVPASLSPQSPSPLAEAFMEDHRQLIQCLHRLLDSLQQAKTTEAVEIADELDQVAGPHIRFEEEFFYPLLAEMRGAKFANRLYEEHSIGCDAVRTLVSHDPSAELTAEESGTLLEEVQTAIDHTLSCGSLLSYVTTLDEPKQAELLAKLRELRRQPIRWTELPQHDTTVAELEAENKR